jgi:hypothetical protein
MKLLNILVVTIFLAAYCENSFSQSAYNLKTFASGNSKEITVHKGDSYLIKIQLSQRTHVSIGIFDDSDKLTEILLYEYLNPGVTEFDIAKKLPEGVNTCKVQIGDNTEVFKIIVI